MTIADDLHETTVVVSGLNCGGCVGTLTRKALGIYGVVHVDVDLDPGRDSMVTLRHGAGVSSDTVASQLADLGYRVRFPATA